MRKEENQFRFFCIIEDDSTANNHRVSLLRKSCKKKNIEFIPIIANSFDFTHSPKLGKNDMLFRASPGNRGRIIEQYFINEQCHTFYLNNMWGACERGASFIMNEHEHLPTINTIPVITKDKVLMKKYVKTLGGFPIILKVMGLSGGIGIIKVESLDSLMSLVDYLVTDNKIVCIMRSYVKHTRQGRLVVLGKKVIASYEKIVQHDFRSNIRFNHKKKKIRYPKNIEQIAIKAVNSLGLEFGGVDLLFNEEGLPYIAEVNAPFYFPIAQRVTGVNITDQMLDYLVKKAKHKNHDRR